LRSDSATLQISVVVRAALAAAFVVALGYWSTTASQTVVDVRDSATSALLQGHGKVLVLIFVRTDCPISNRYAPLLQQMEKKYGQEVFFRLVFPDRNESPEKIRSYLKDYGYDLAAIRDLDHALVKKTFATITPESAVFNAKGQLVYHGRIDNLYEHLGQPRSAATTHELADAIDAASKGENPRVSSANAVGCFISDLE
jgi:thiol-disulfide isomerase/thioredoxin